MQRWSWSRAEDERKKRESAQADADRVAFQSIDWFDFVVVETIDFADDEQFDVPLLNTININNNTPHAATPSAAGYMMPPKSTPSIPSFAVPSLHASSRPSAFPQSLPPPPPTLPPSSADDDDMDMDMDMDDDVPPPPPLRSAGVGAGVGVGVSYRDLQAQALASIQQHEEAQQDHGEEEGDIRVVANYRPRLAPVAASQPTMMRDPLSGRVVAAADMTEHMRVQLLDPRWRLEQQRFQDKQKESGFAEGVSIADNLKHFATKRGDIFGSNATATSSYSSGISLGALSAASPSDHFADTNDEVCPFCRKFK